MTSSARITRQAPDMVTSNPSMKYLQVADWRVDPASNQVCRGKQVNRLEPRVMAVLVYLATHPGEAVTREELESAVWAGAVVGYDAVTSTIQKLRKALDDDPREPRIIETLSKKGYRLIAPVTTAARARATPVPPADAGKATQPWYYRLSTVLLAGMTLVVLFAGFWWLGLVNTSDISIPPASPDLSIAVLPFDNLDKDVEQEYFADGMTDDIITELAKRPELLVIARDSTFIYKNQPLDIEQLSEQLKVRYLLSGSVRRADNKLRINVQLIDATTGGHVWAERYDGELSSVFEFQDRITRSIVSALAVKVSTGQQQDLGKPLTMNTDAYDNFLYGRQVFYQYANKNENARAREYFLTAIEDDPEFAMAYAMLAWTHVFDVMNGWSTSRESSLNHARELAEKATSLDEVIPIAYFVKGLTYRENGEYVSALFEAEKAIEYDPNYANAHVLLATLLYYAGRSQEGLERIKKAIQLNPHHPYNYTFHLGQAYYILRRYEEAIDAFKQGISSNPTSERLRVWLAAAYAQIDEIDKAKWEVEWILMLNPEFTLARMQQTFPFKHPSDRKHFLQGLHKAGLK